MNTKDTETHFDSLFTLAESDPHLITIQQSHAAQTKDINNLATQATNRIASLHLSGSKTGGRGSLTPAGGSRTGSGHGSRGSPVRKNTKTTLCPSNPAILGSAAARSNSMRDQTSHMKEKYQSKYQQRRTSIKTPTNSKDVTPKAAGSRNNSLTPSDVEVTRQFLATNKKVINRGDSFKKRQRPVLNRDKVEISIKGIDDIQEIEKVEKHPKKIYRVAFLGSGEVGKTSIIDQFMSSEHADVYDEYIHEEENVGNEDVSGRILTVDVNNTLTQISLVEANSDTDISDIVEEHNPDCYVLVYAVDDKESFDSLRSSLSWLSSNNCLSGKSCILVGNKADLARTRVVDTGDGCDLAIQFGLKFTETSPGMGHHIDELLVGIVMQLRLHENRSPSQPHHGIKHTLMGFLNIFTGKEDEKRKSCRNLNM